MAMLNNQRVILLYPNNPQWTNEAYWSQSSTKGLAATAQVVLGRWVGN